MLVDFVDLTVDCVNLKLPGTWERWVRHVGTLGSARGNDGFGTWEALARRSQQRILDGFFGRLRESETKRESDRSVRATGPSCPYRVAPETACNGCAIIDLKNESFKKTSRCNYKVCLRSGIVSANGLSGQRERFGTAFVGL